MILKRTLLESTVKDAMKGENRHKVKKMNIRPDVLYGSDFETNPPKDGVVNVWLWAIVRASDNRYIVGETIEEWYEEVMKLTGIVCFHNAKFDCAFVLDYLERNSIPYEKDFTIIDASMHVPYRVALKRDLYIQDTMRVHNTSLDKMAESYGLEGKSEKADFTVFHEYGKSTCSEREYVRQDATIVAQVLRLDCIENNGYIPITGAGYALKCYTDWFKTTPMANPVTKRGHSALESMFPNTFEKPLDDSWEALAVMCYMGGICIVKSGIEGRILGRVLTYDKNSAYPYQMCDKPLPVKQGKPVETYVEGEWGIYYIECMFDHEDRSCPVIHKSRVVGKHLPVGDTGFDNRFTLYGQSDYIEWYHGTLVVTSTEIEYLRKYADLYFEVKYGFVFETRDDVFRDYIKPIYEERQKIKKTNPVRAEFLKLKMNSLYGKFGTGAKYGFVNGIGEDGIYHEVIDPNEVSYPWCYTPIAVAITSYQRIDIATVISGNWSNFLYTDTDSVHLSAPPEPGSMWLDDKTLGAYKLESSSESCRYIRPKCYGHRNETEFNNDGSIKSVKPIVIKCGGMPQNIKGTIKSLQELHINAVFEGKLMPRHYIGGVHLEPTTYKITDGYRM